MTAFIWVEALMALLASALVLWPLVTRKDNTPPSVAFASGIAILVLACSAGLYALWSNASWAAATNATDPASMVAKLARQLERQPNNVGGWLMLGRSYSVLEQYSLATKAFQRADRLSGGRSAEALTGWAEALVLSNERELDDRAGRLFEQALALDPDSGKALFFSAVAAQRRGELDIARTRYRNLLSLNPPAQVRPVLEQQVAALDAQLKGQGAGVAGSATPAVTTDASVRVRVALAKPLAAAGDAGALFVLVRRVGQGGPPLAAKKLAATFPQDVVLTPADAMIQGLGFEAGQTVEVVARIARGGTPIAQSGDPFGKIQYRVGKDAVRDIIIDKVSP